MWKREEKEVELPSALPALQATCPAAKLGVVFLSYVQPGREDFRQTLQSAMPKLLTNGHKTPNDEMREMLNEVKPKALRERLLKVWAKL